MLRARASWAARGSASPSSSTSSTATAAGSTSKARRAKARPLPWCCRRLEPQGVEQALEARFAAQRPEGRELGDEWRIVGLLVDTAFEGVDSLRAIVDRHRLDRHLEPLIE